MIVARDLVVRLGRRDVVCGVDLEVRSGEVLGVVGPNGAGKSTLLRALAGELAPWSGTVTLRGRDAAAMGAAALARERAVVSQRADVAFDFPAREVVAWGRAPHAPVETPRCAEMARRALEAVGLGAVGGEVVSRLSGGEQQRVHVARALAQIGFGETGRYLLLDEPTASLDPAQQQAVLEVVRGLRGADVAVAVVLHDVGLAAWACDRVGLMRAGRLVAVGPPREVLTRERLRDVFDTEVVVDDAPWDASVPRVTFVPKRRAW